MIPDNQTIELQRVTAWDKYKEPLTTEKFTMRARIVNETKKTTNAAGKEVLTTLTVLIKTSELKRSQALKVLYNDRFKFIDEFGNTITNREPQNIAPARGLSGKSLFTRVFI